MGAPQFSQKEREKLWSEFQPLVRRLIRQYGDTHEDRQDLAGEIFCRFTDLLTEFEPSRGVPLKPYLVRKLIASVYTYARSQWRRQRHEMRMETCSDALDARTAGDPTPEWNYALMKGEMLDRLTESMQRLPQCQRQVIIWRFYESRSYEEIAEMLGVKDATARSLARHGINNLRRYTSPSDDL